MPQLETNPIQGTCKAPVRAAKHSTRLMMHVLVIEAQPARSENKEELVACRLPLAATDRPIRDMHLTTRQTCDL